MAGWTDYAKQQMFGCGLGVLTPPTFYLALYVGSADPAGPPTELTLAGYAREEFAYVLVTADEADNQADITFGPMAAGVYQGVAMLDDPVAGAVWFWNDEIAPVAIVAASTVTFAAGDLQAIRVP